MEKEILGTIVFLLIAVGTFISGGCMIKKGDDTASNLGFLGYFLISVGIFGLAAAFLLGIMWIMK